ncbi:MAG: DoxX family protein [Myxococcota bacterium]
MRESTRAHLLHVALLLLRLGAGGMLLGAHGWPKVMAFGTRAGSFADPLGVGSAASLSLVVFAEVVCAGLVMLGLLTRAAALTVVLMMCVAVFVQHAGDPWSSKELPLLYLLAFSTFVLSGAGRWSADHLLRLPARAPLRWMA